MSASPFSPGRLYRVRTTFELFKQRFTEGEILRFVKSHLVIYDSLTEHYFIDEGGRSRKFLTDFDAPDEEVERFIEEHFEPLPASVDGH